jgi:long-subunit acyl-CoA synthetase (AMP-forming)
VCKSATEIEGRPVFYKGMSQSPGPGGYSLQRYCAKIEMLINRIKGVHICLVAELRNTKHEGSAQEFSRGGIARRLYRRWAPRTALAKRAYRLSKRADVQAHQLSASRGPCPFDDNSFDRASSMLVLQFIPDAFTGSVIFLLTDAAPLEHRQEHDEPLWPVVGGRGVC